MIKRIHNLNTRLLDLSVAVENGEEEITHFRGGLKFMLAGHQVEPTGYGPKVSGLVDTAVIWVRIPRIITNWVPLDIGDRLEIIVPNKTPVDLYFSYHAQPNVNALLLHYDPENAQHETQ